MDVSGVDVDFLNNEEILELCSDIVDTKSEEISVLKGIDVNNLSDDKVNKLYDDFLNEQNTQSKKLFMNDEQVLDNNFNIIDMEEDEIALFNGHNVNIDMNNLSDEEILALYNDVVTNENNLLATVDSQTSGTYIKCDYTAQTCYVYSKYSGYSISCHFTDSSGKYVACYFSYSQDSGTYYGFCYYDGTLTNITYDTYKKPRNLFLCYK